MTYFDKKNIWIVGKFLQILAFILYSRLLPGQAGYWDLFFPIILVIVGMTSGAAVAPALLSELIDYSNWKFNVKTEIPKIRKTYRKNIAQKISEFIF